MAFTPISLLIQILIRFCTNNVLRPYNFFILFDLYDYFPYGQGQDEGTKKYDLCGFHF